MNALKRSSSCRIVLAVVFSIVVYAGVSPSLETDAMGIDRSGSLLVNEIESAMPSVFNSAFDSPGEFRFITPIAPNPHDAAADFDDSLLPYLNVSICRVAGNECVPVRTFNSQGATAQRLRIEHRASLGSYYIVNWDASRGAVDNTSVYRISVDAAGIELGSVDLGPSLYKPFGRTWPIKFIIEKDAALRIQVLAAAGTSIWEVADDLRTELGICDDELRQVLLDHYPNATAEQVAEVVNGVCQDVELFPTTKIADRATRDALAMFDMSTGRMVFASDTTLLKNLNVGDVIVSRPSPAAPYGYLRKVSSIRKDKGIYTLETVQAKFTEAIRTGKLQASGPLLPSNSAATARQSAPSALNNKSISASFDEGDQFTFKEHIDTEINLDGGDDEIGGTGVVKVIGDVYINAGYNIGAGIEWCGIVPCVDRLEAWMGFEQKSDLRIIGTFDGKVHKEIAYPIPMQPIFFMIGFFPVVLVPEINVIVGIDGKAHIDFEFKAGSEVNMKPYLKWTEDDGWRDLSKIDDPFSKTYSDVNITGTIEMEVYAKLDAALLLYGAIGPSADGSLGIGATAQTGGSPLWTIFGHAKVGIGLRSLFTDLFDIGSPELVLAEDRFEIARAANEKPVCSGRGGVIPVDLDARVFLGPSGNGIGGYFNCTDPDGDSSQITYLPISTDSDDRFSNMWTRFLTADQRTVTITATDQDGENEQVILIFRPQNSLPVITPFAASNTVGVGVQYFINALVYDWEKRGYLNCGSLGSVEGVKFLVQSPNVSTSFADDFNCSAEVVFAAPGLHTILITARDKNGGYSEQPVTVNVTAAPTDPAPVINRSSIDFSAVARTSIRKSGDIQLIICEPGQICLLPNGESIDTPGQTLFDYILPFHLSFDAVDPNGQTLTKKWYCRWVSLNPVIAEMTQNPDGSFGCGQAPPGAPVFVWGTVSDGTTTVSTDMRNYILGSGLR